MKEPTADINLREEMRSKSDKDQMSIHLLGVIGYLSEVNEVSRREGMLALENQIDEIPDLSDVMIEKGVRSVVDGDDKEMLEKRLRAWQSFLNARAELVIQGITDLWGGMKAEQFRENMLAKIPEPLKEEVGRLLKEKSR